LRRLLSNVRYISEREAMAALVEQNGAVLSRLEEAGVAKGHTVYVQVHDAGSSSPVMLNLLRDAARIEKAGYRFLDSRNKTDLADLTGELGDGAIIYIDDFSASGNQFLKARGAVSECIQGSFSEFFVLPCVCEEGMAKIEREGVQVFARYVHSRSERPLHEDCTTLEEETKEKLIRLSKCINHRWGLGYQQLATMVVLYNNAPNTVPLLLRGSPHQEPYVGVLPRTTDLPPRLYSRRL
jgi:hypothetical protein